jgi:Tol biopolymer transport system component
MNRLLVLTSVALAPSLLAGFAEGQSLTRLQAPGGRQTFASTIPAGFTPDGHFALALVADGVIPGDANGYVDLAWFDLWTGEVRLAVTGAGGAATNEGTWAAGMSANGRHVVFDTLASNLGPPDSNDLCDAYLLDRLTGQIARVSLGLGGVEPDADSGGGEFDSGAASDDGRFALFGSTATNLGFGPTAKGQVYVRDIQANTTELISCNTSGAPGNDDSDGARISADGRFVAFISGASDLVPADGNGSQDVFVRDRLAGTTRRVNLGPGGVEADNEAYGVDMSPDGRWIVFDSTATNLVPGTTGLIGEVFLIDVQTAILSLQSVGPGGAPSDGSSLLPTISDDGRWIAFLSDATTLDPVDSDLHRDVFVRDAVAGTTRLASVATNGDQGHAPQGLTVRVEMPMISADGALVGFESNLQGLVAGDTNVSDAFVSDRRSSVPPVESYCRPKVNSLGCTPTITSGGEPRVAGASDDFFLSAHNVRNRQVGLLLWSGFASSTPFYGGTLCVAPPLQRTPAHDSRGSPVGASCSGTYWFHFSQAYMAAKSVGPGLLVHGQFWSRDQGFPAPNNVGLTDAIRFTTAP